jgi:hypothetical protein
MGWDYEREGGDYASVGTESGRHIRYPGVTGSAFLLTPGSTRLRVLR